MAITAVSLMTNRETEACNRVRHAVNDLALDIGHFKDIRPALRAFARAVALMVVEAEHGTREDPADAVEFMFERMGL